MKDPVNLRRAYSIGFKEVRHIWRDPFTLSLALGLPLLMVLFFGLAMDFNVHDIHLTAYDRTTAAPPASSWKPLRVRAISSPI